MVPGMTKFREHNVYRDWVFEKADEDLPLSEIFDADPDNNLSEERRARKKRRIEDHGFNYIKGRPIHINSARLQGPFGSSWASPWAKTGAASIYQRNEARNGSGANGRTPQDLHDLDAHEAKKVELRKQVPRIKPLKAVPAQRVTPIEGSDHPPQSDRLSVSHKNHRRQSSNASDRTLDWLRRQKEHRHTPEANDDSFIALGPTPSRPPNASVARSRDSNPLGTSKTSARTSNGVGELSPDTTTRNPAVRRRSGQDTEAHQPSNPHIMAQVEIPQSSGVGVEQHGSSRGMVLRDDPAPAIPNVRGTLNDGGSAHHRKHSEPQGTNILQPRNQNKPLPLVVPTSNDEISKVSGGAGSPNLQTKSGMPRRGRQPASDGPGMIQANQQTRKSAAEASSAEATEISRPPRPDGSEFAHETNNDATPQLTRSMAQQSAERCGTRSAKGRSNPSERWHEAEIATATGPSDLNSESAGAPSKPQNKHLQHKKHPYNASPITSRDSPGFAYRRVSAHAQASSRDGGDSVSVSAGKALNPTAPQKRAGVQSWADKPTGVEGVTKQGAVDRASDKLVTASEGLAGSEVQTPRRGSPVEKMDVERMTDQQRWEFIERYTNRVIPDDGNSPTNRNSIGARLRRAMRASGASFVTVEDEGKGPEELEPDHKDTSNESSHGHTRINPSGASIPYHQVPPAPSDTNLSTQAAFLKAHQTFQDDLQSPAKPNTPLGITNNQAMKPPAITPFREINPQLRTTHETPNEGALSTQAMLDQAADIAFSTVKKRKPKKRASFAASVENHRTDTTGMNQEDKSSKPMPVYAESKSASQPLAGFFNFLAQPGSQQDVPLRSAGSQSSVPASSTVPVPSWASSSAASGSARPRSSVQDAQRQHNEVEADAFLDDATSFLEPWSLEAAMRA